jgi:glutamine cyclotransferase
MILGTQPIYLNHLILTLATSPKALVYLIILYINLHGEKEKCKYLCHKLVSLSYSYNNVTGDIAYTGESELPIPEGWGITTDEKELILTDGSEKLYFVDSNTLKVNRFVPIHEKNRKHIQLSNFNELEYIDGYVYANIWLRNLIAVIDPTTGEILRYLDLSKLSSFETTKNREHVLNGIAYDKSTGK